MREGTVSAKKHRNWNDRQHISVGVVDGHASYASATLQAPDRRRVAGSVFGTAGRVWVNTTIDGGPQLPAGGYKASGFGREMGYAGLEEVTEIKPILYRLGKREPFSGSDSSRRGF
jgi:hypothetical protein